MLNKYKSNMFRQDYKMSERKPPSQMFNDLLVYRAMEVIDKQMDITVIPMHSLLMHIVL